MNTDRDAAAIGAALIDMLDDACLVFDQAGIVTWAGAHCASIFGLAPEALVGKRRDDLLVELDASPDTSAFERERCHRAPDVEADEWPAAFSARARQPDGTRMPVRVRCRPVAASQGKLVIALLRPFEHVSPDVRETRELLQAVADSATAVIYIKSVDGRYVLVNRLYEQLFHRSNSEMQGLTDYDLFDRDVADRLRANDVSVLQGGRPVEFDETVPVDGEAREYISLKFPVFGPSGKPYALCGISTDITVRKRAELGLLKAQSRLEHLVAERTSDLSQADRLLRQEASLREEVVTQLSTLVATAGEGIWTLDLAGRTTFANPRMAEMFGYSVDEMIGMPLQSFVDAKWVPEVERNIGTRHEGVPNRFDFCFRRKDGSELWALISRSELRDRAGNLVGLLAMLTDITERKRAEDHQLRLLRELDHRVKNSLAVVVAIADLIMTRAESVSAFRRSFGERIQALARTHEALARAEWRDVGFAEVVDVVLAAHRASFGERIHVQGDVVKIPSRLTTPLALALSELATNALKHGVLTRDCGGVAIAWERTADGEFVVTWNEQGEVGSAPMCAANTDVGAGLMLLRGLIEYELEGRVELDFDEQGVRCRLTVPLDEGGRDEAL